MVPPVERIVGFKAKRPHEKWASYAKMGVRTTRNRHR